MEQVYIYESCIPVATLAIKKTLVIQTEKIDIFDVPGTIFKDSNNNCWTYNGNFNSNYIPDEVYFVINFSGNYFTNIVNIKYPSCDSCVVTKTSDCSLIYFSSTRCDNGENVIVKCCDVSPITGTLKLTPTVGQIHGISNPNGDDFCVKLDYILLRGETDYEIETPAWINYTCDICPIYKKYTVDSCDGLIENLSVFASTTATTLDVGTVVRIDTDDNCYVITSYDGIKSEYLITQPTTIIPTDSFGFNKQPKIIYNFTNCNDCINSFYN